MRIVRPTESDVITQHFGSTAVDYSKWGVIGHPGTDRRAPEGSPIVSPIAGLASAKENPPGFGHYVFVVPGRAIMCWQGNFEALWLEVLDGPGAKAMFQLPTIPEGAHTIYGTLLIFLAHLSKQLAPTSGVQVSAGRLVGRAGSSGNSTAAHLHEEWRFWGWDTWDGKPHPYKGAFNAEKLYQEA